MQIPSNQNNRANPKHIARNIIIPSNSDITTPKKSSLSITLYFNVQKERGPIY